MSYKKTSKKKYILIAVVALLLLGIATVFGAQISKDDQGYRTISVIEVSGRVSIVKNGVEYTAYPGMLLQEGQEVVTSGSSHVRMALDDDKYIKLESGSRAVFETLGLLGSGKTAINLERGSLTSELVNPLGAQDSYVINTPNAVLAVRGTFFRVDLSISDEGDVKSDVMTYGGQVASQRVQPTGEVVEEEVLIDAGYKATINMTTEETHYVVETENGETIIVEPPASNETEDDTLTEVALPTQPISTSDIPDEDLVDVYFAAENGHELFVTSEEVKTDLEEREIVLEEYKPVYEKAEEVKLEQEIAKAKESGISNTTSASIKADDSQSIVIAPVVKEEGNTSTAPGMSTTVQNNISSGLVDGVHVHKEKKTTTEATCTTPGRIVVTCRECKEKLSETEIPATGHTYTDAITKAATCTTTGTLTHSCSCGDSYTEEIAALGHTIVNTAYVAPGCTTAGSSTYACNCGYSYTETIVALGHNYASEFSIDKAATCTTEGSKSKHCAQCSSLKDVTVIAATGHTEVYAGASDAHTRCGVCSVVLSIQHEFTSETYEVGTCITPNKVKFSCACGFYSISQAGYGDHEYVVLDEFSQECKHCGDIIEETVLLDSINFPDENFRALLATTAYDINQDGSLSKTEIMHITGLAVNGEGDEMMVNVDGGISDLTGIEYLTEITNLNVSYNSNLTELDVSNNTKLQYITANTTGIERIDTSNCTQLVALSIEHNSQLKDVDISDSVHLKSLLLRNAYQLSELDISDNTELTNINLSGDERLTNLVLSETGYPDIMVLDITNNGLEEMDFGVFTNLETLRMDGSLLEADLSGCNNLSSVYLDGGSYLETFICTSPVLTTLELNSEQSFKTLVLKDTALTSLDISKCPNLEVLNISNSDITLLEIGSNENIQSIDASMCKSLEEITMRSGSMYTEFPLTSVNVDGCSALHTLTLKRCKNLTELNVATCGALSTLSLDDSSNISFVDIAPCFALTSLDISDTNIANIDLSHNTALTFFYAERTPMTSLDLSGYSNIATVDITESDITRLNLSNCANLGNVELNPALEELVLSGCTRIQTVDFNPCSNIKKIDISNSGIPEIGGNLSEGLVNLSASTVQEFYMNDAVLEVKDTGNLGWLSNVKVFKADGSTLTNDDWALIAPNLTNVEELSLSDTNQTGAFDASSFTKLTRFIMAFNGDITEVDLTGCTELTMLSISGLSQVQNLNLDTNTKLEEIVVDTTGITTLDFLNPCKDTLQYLSCSNLPITEITPTTYPALVSLQCQNTQITNFSANGSTLIYLDISHNDMLQQVNVEETLYLQRLEVNECDALVSVFAWGNQELISIYAQNNPNMGLIQPQDNPCLKLLDLTGSTMLSSGIPLGGSATTTIANGEMLTVVITGTSLTEDAFNDRDELNTIFVKE